MDYGKFTREQVLFITFVGICGNMSHTFTWSYYLAERSGWVVFGMGILLQIPFVMAVLYICRNYARYTIFDIIGEGFGKFLYIIVVFIYSIITIALGIFMLNMFVGTVKIYFLPFTPSWIPMLFIVFMAILLVNNRTLLFGRIFELLSVWFIINYFAGFSLSFVKKFKIENVIPVFDINLLKFEKGMFFSMGNASEILLLIMVMVIHIPAAYKHWIWVIKGIIVTCFILTVAIFIMEGISGYELLIRSGEAGIDISRAIYIGDFIRGLEVFILATYQLITILKISLYIYGIWIPIRKLFDKKYSTIILFLIALLMFLPSAWLNSSNTAYFLSIFTTSYIVLPFAIIVMILASLGMRIIKKRSGGD